MGKTPLKETRTKEGKGQGVRVCAKAGATVAQKRDPRLARSKMEWMKEEIRVESLCTYQRPRTTCYHRGTAISF